jgi:signal peptidase II
MGSVAVSRGSKIALLLLAAVLFGLDRWTKMAVAESMELYSSETIINGFFNLVHVRNTGIAFSLLNDAGPLVKDWILPAASAAAILLILWIFWRTDSLDGRGRFALTLVLAGAAGNLYDRAMYGYVVDFLDFYVADRHWPAFNVADSCITVGALLLILDSMRKPDAAEARYVP